MMKKIQVVGDSLLKGVIYDETLKKHVLLKDNGISKLIDEGYNIINDAKFGLTIKKARRIIEGGDLDSDSIILEVGGNDCDFNWDEVSENPHLDHQAKTPIDVFEQSLIDLVTFIMDHDIKPILVSIPPLDDTLFFDFICQNRNKANILTFLGDINQIYKHQKQYSDVISRVAKMLNLTCIPLREIIESNGSYQTMYCLDGMHLNKDGQEIIYKAFLNHVR